MSRFDTKDQQMLEEAYSQIQEGMWDRFKARGAEAIGSAKGLGQKIKGGIQQNVASAVSGMGDTGKAFSNDLAQKGQQNIESGKASGHNAKIEYLKNNIDKRIQKLVGGIKEDIQKLGLEIGNIEMISGINDALNKLKMSVNAPTSQATPPPFPKQATPPPLPSQDDNDEPEDEPEYTYSYPPKRKTKPKAKPPTTNPKKSKVNPNALKNRMSRPEQEERFK